jgi:hypothetical protein
VPLLCYTLHIGRFTHAMCYLAVSTSSSRLDLSIGRNTIAVLFTEDGVYTGVTGLPELEIDALDDMVSATDHPLPSPPAVRLCVYRTSG